MVLSLLTLAALAIVVDQHLAELGDDISDVASPVRTAVREIQVELALETAGTRGYLLTGDSSFVRGHQRARTARKEAVARLQAVAPRAEPELRELVAQLDVQLRPADAALDSLYGGQLSRDEYVARLPTQQLRLEAVVATVRQVGAVVSEGTFRRFAHVRTVQQRALVITVLLVVLTLAASVQVTRLGLSYRSLAARAQTAHEESEAARHEAERRRIESEQIAESRARLMRGFTHDVKNPLGAAAGYLDLIEHGSIDPKDGVKSARRTLKSALSLIEDLLTLARAESGEITIRRAPLDLRAVARAAVDDARTLATSKGLSLAVETPDALPPLESDEARIRQVLDNLVSNAIKYTPSGAVTVTVRMCSDGQLPGAAPCARVDVCDTGPGMSPEQQRLVFEEFYRLDSSSGIAGSGLGLAISRRIAAALGGDVVVASQVGTGSTFSLLLPGNWIATPDPADAARTT
ncbi:MAG TPA: ATP-binding protein [Longimicrobiales bacterium]|nr:ATP-binding protein [Longimicrobiales bacterium]